MPGWFLELAGDAANALRLAAKRPRNDPSKCECCSKCQVALNKKRPITSSPHTEGSRNKRTTTARKAATKVGYICVASCSYLIASIANRITICEEIPSCCCETLRQVTTQLRHSYFYTHQVWLITSGKTGGGSKATLVLRSLLQYAKMTHG